MSVRLIRDGKWGETCNDGIIHFHVGDIYRGCDQEKLVKAGWAEYIDDEDIPHPHPHSSVVKQTVSLALFIPACDDDFFTTADGEDLPPDKLSYGEPIDTKQYSNGVYFGFAAPGLPDTGARVFKILHSDDIDGGYEPVGVDNLVYGNEDGRFPAIVNFAKPDLPDPAMPLQGAPMAREGVVDTKRYVKIGMWAGGARGGSAIAIAVHDAKVIPVPDDRTWYHYRMRDMGEKSSKLKGVPDEMLFALNAGEAVVKKSFTTGVETAPTENVKETSDASDTIRDILEKIAAGADSEKDAKMRIGKYAKGKFSYTIDKRKSLKQIIEEIVDMGFADAE